MTTSGRWKAAGQRRCYLIMHGIPLPLRVVEQISIRPRLIRSPREARSADSKHETPRSSSRGRPADGNGIEIKTQRPDDPDKG